MVKERKVLLKKSYSSVWLYCSESTVITLLKCAVCEKENDWCYEKYIYKPYAHTWVDVNLKNIFTSLCDLLSQMVITNGWTCQHLQTFNTKYLNFGVIFHFKALSCLLLTSFMGWCTLSTTLPTFCGENLNLIKRDRNFRLNCRSKHYDSQPHSRMALILEYQVGWE